MVLVLTLGRVWGVAPANDNLRDAILLTGTNFIATGTNVDAKKEVGEPNHGPNPGGRSVWWAWTAPATGSAMVETAGSSFDTLLAAYTGTTFALLNTVAYSDDDGRLATSAIAFNVLAGVSYRFAVDGYNGAAGDIQLGLRFQPQPLVRPANDDFAHRILVNGPLARVAGANFLASKETGEPNHAGELGGASVWWSWTAPSSGQAILSTAGSDIDTLLAVYTGTVLTNLVLVARNDDLSTNEPASRVSFLATAGTAYEIAIDGFHGQTGEIKWQLAMEGAFHLELAGSPPLSRAEVRLLGPPGASYVLERSTDLREWTPVAIQTNTTGTVEFSDPQFLSFPRRFYRARFAD